MPLHARFAYAVVGLQCARQLGFGDDRWHNSDAQSQQQNEITSVSGATTLTFDANSNMTKNEAGKQYVYDTWNRIKIVKDAGVTTLKTYTYDAMNHRVSETVGSPHAS